MAVLKGLVSAQSPSLVPSHPDLFRCMQEKRAGSGWLGTRLPAHMCSPHSSVLGECLWALKCNLRFWPTWVLTQDQNSIRLYGSCCSGPLKWGTWVLTREWALVRGTTIMCCCDYCSCGRPVLMERKMVTIEGAHERSTLIIIIIMLI